MVASNDLRNVLSVIFGLSVLEGKSCGHAYYNLLTYEFTNIFVDVLKKCFQVVNRHEVPGIHCSHVSDSAVTILLFTLRYDNDVSHLRILTRRLPDSCWSRHHVLQDLVPAEDEAPIEAYITEVTSAPPPPPSFLPSLIRPPHTRASMVQMRAAAPSTYHPLLPSGTPPMVTLSTTAPSIAPELIFTRLDTPASSIVLWETRGRRLKEEDDGRLRGGQLEGQLLAMRVEIEVLRRERLAYEQEMLETQARRHEWQRQDADDRATRHIMRIQALEAGARDDTLEDTGSSA
ncbi:hypothetical protein Tco_0389415 [Tanacetum coccineum]